MKTKSISLLATTLTALASLTSALGQCEDRGANFSELKSETP